MTTCKLFRKFYMPHICDIGPTATFRFSVTNMRSKHDLYQAMKIEY